MEFRINGIEFLRTLKIKARFDVAAIDLTWAQTINNKNSPNTFPSQVARHVICCMFSFVFVSIVFFSSVRSLFRCKDASCMHFIIPVHFIFVARNSTKLIKCASDTLQWSLHTSHATECQEMWSCQTWHFFFSLFTSLIFQYGCGCG